MPAASGPTVASGDDCVTVHAQRNDCGPPNGGEAFNARAVEAPFEMVRPLLSPRMEKRHEFAGQGVFGLGRVAFELVARTAGQAHVFKRGIATFGDGADMVEGQRNAAVRFTGQAIATAVTVSVRDAVAQFFRDVDRHGGSRSGYVVSSPAEKQGGMGFAEHEQVRLGSQPRQFQPFGLAQSTA